MHAAPITALFGEIPEVPLPPQAVAPSAPSFSDMLASATSSLAAFALLPTSTSDALGGLSEVVPRARTKDFNTDSVSVPIALPAPVQFPPAATSNDAGSDATASRLQQASGAADQQQAQTAPQTTASTGPAGTDGTSSGSAQAAGGVALPPMAAELKARLALGAQALLSQPSQALATLPHGALQAVATSTLASNLAGAAHAAAQPDPAAVLPKLATVAGAALNATASTLEIAQQSVAAQITPTPSADGIDLAAFANTGDTATSLTTDTGPGTVPAPAAVPLSAADAAPAMEAATAPMVATSALDQVAASLSQSNKLGLSQIEIQLKPASLGAVDVKIELSHDGRVAAVISADRSDTLMQLERGSGELQQALRDAGLQTDSGSLSFSLRGDPRTGDQYGRQPSNGPAETFGDDPLAMPGAVASASQSAHSGLLNIQV